MISLIVIARWSWVSPDISDANCGLGENAAWISVDWTSQAVSESSVAQLAQSASARQIRYLFPFTTYVKPDGTFSPSYAHAAEFVSQFRRFNQETLLLAWIGIPLPIADLSDESTRRDIAASVAQLVQEAQFDGVHLNAEPISNNDLDYLAFLDQVRDALGPRYTISIAGSQWTSTASSKLPLVNDNQARWDDEYYQAVAERVDQIAVMAYDSVRSHPALYRLWLREQVRGISKCLANSDAELLIGISISREDTITHRPKAENMQSGLAGICAGLITAQENTVRGVAIYAAWEGEPSDWQTWDAWVATPLCNE